MAYTRLNLPDGATFEAAHVVTLEDGIVAAHQHAEDLAGEVRSEIPTDVVSPSDLAPYALKTELPDPAAVSAAESRANDYTDDSVDSVLQRVEGVEATVAQQGALRVLSTPFYVRHTGAEWEHLTLESAKTEGLVDDQSVVFVGPSPAPSWARPGTDVLVAPIAPAVAPPAPVPDPEP